MNELKMKKYVIYLNEGYCFGTDNIKRAAKRYEEIKKENKLLDLRCELKLTSRLWNDTKDDDGYQVIASDFQIGNKR